MKTLRLALIASASAISLSVAQAQAPPPVPGLPDTPRITSYALTGGTCACAVNFALYGDSTDYWDWVEVWINGVYTPYNSPTAPWTITSPTGPVGNIPRPITDAVLTFGLPVTGTVELVGARRPRRVTQFQESRGVPARDLNQALTDIIAMLREGWDKINDVTGRALLSQPGNTVGILPLPATCANAYLVFDATGLNPLCAAVLNPIATGLGVAAALLNAVNEPGGFNVLGAREFNVLGPGAMGNGVHADGPAIQSVFTAAAGGGSIKIPCGVYKIGQNIAVALANYQHIKIEGGGSDCTELWFSGGNYGATINWGGPFASVDVSGVSITTDQVNPSQPGLSLVNGNSVAGVPNLSFGSNNFYDVVFRGHDTFTDFPTPTEHWATGFYERSVNELNFYGGSCNFGNGIQSGTCYSFNGTPASGPTAAVETIVVNFFGTATFNCGTSWYYGQQVEGIYLVATQSTGCNIGVSIPANTTGVPVRDQITISGGAQFEDSTFAVDIEDVDFQNIQINGGFFIVPGYLTWVASYAGYTSGTQIANPVSGGNLYTETVASCVAASTGTGPSGTGTGITDGTCSWNYAGAPHVNTAIKLEGVGGNTVQNSQIAATGQGATVGIEIAGSIINAAGNLLQSNDIGNFGKGIAIDNGINGGVYAYYNLMINNTVDYSLGSGGATGFFIKDKNIRNLSNIIACSSATWQSEFLQADSTAAAWNGVAAGSGAETMPIVCDSANYRNH